MLFQSPLDRCSSIVKKTASSSSVTVLASDPELQFPVKAGLAYVVWIDLYATQSSGTGVEIGALVPTGAQMQLMGIEQSTYSSVAQYTADETTLSSTQILTQTAGTTPCVINACLWVLSPVDGTVAIQFASVTSLGTVTITAGSCITIWQAN
jgi:hypothetical protein